MMSPRKASFGFASAVELMNSSEAGERPIASSASGSAGITPPLTVMQRKFSSAAERHDRQPGDAAVEPGEGAQQQVGEDVQRLAERRRDRPGRSTRSRSGSRSPRRPARPSAAARPRARTGARARAGRTAGRAGRRFRGSSARPTSARAREEPTRTGVQLLNSGLQSAEKPLARLLKGEPETRRSVT